MKKLSILFIFFSLFFATSASAACDAPKPAVSSDYNSVIIPDTVFRNYSSMGTDVATTTQAISSFLQSKGSALAGYSVDYDVYIGPGDTVQARNMTAAQVIANVAFWYRVNPQVILAKINSESSLITSGTLQYLDQTMGYTYYENGTWNSTYANFAKQVDGGVYQFDHDFRGSEARNTGWVGQYYKGNTITLDGRAVYIGASATAAFYKYTPHRVDSAWINYGYAYGCPVYYYGNYNVLYFFTRWFNVDSYIKGTDNLRTTRINTIVSTEQATYYFTLKNYLPEDVLLDSVQIATYNPDAPVQDAIYSADNVTLGETGGSEDSLSINANHTFRYAGTYKVWIAYKINGTWYTPGTSFNGEVLYFYVNTRLPNITVSSPLIIYPSYPAIGENVTSKYKITNNESVPININKIMVASWYNYPQPNDRNFTPYAVPSGVLAPGQTGEITSVRTFSDIGYHYSWIAMEIAGKWYNIPAGTGSVAAVPFLTH